MREIKILIQTPPDRFFFLNGEKISHKDLAKSLCELKCVVLLLRSPQYNETVGPTASLNVPSGSLQNEAKQPVDNKWWLES